MVNVVLCCGNVVDILPVMTGFFHSRAMVRVRFLPFFFLKASPSSTHRGGSLLD